MDKQQILSEIYNHFDTWAAQESFVCAKGCATCCTQNVMITATEGERIMTFIREKGLQEWLAGCLNATPSPFTPALTTNEDAANCLAGIDSDEETVPPRTPCPFLDDSNSCSIYEVRPFSCRSFSSQCLCTASTPAQTTENYMSGSMAASQLIEHLGQGEYWGNMLDVLCVLSDISINRDICKLLIPDKAPAVRSINLRSGKPLPGFLILEEEWEAVSPLLNAIFTTRIDHRTIEEIFNGKQ